MPDITANTDLPIIAAIQLSSCDDIQTNLDNARVQLELAKNKGAWCAVLPENFAWMGHDDDALDTSEQLGSGIVQTFLAETARDLDLWLIGGSHRIRVENDTEQRVSNTSLIFNPQGKQVARYDKIHLFDADVNDGTYYRESDTIKAGNATTIVDTDFARIGLTICYDLRFPDLYQTLRLQGADIIVVPAAFTVPTGMAHWKTLLRARAIENQVYIIAPAQCGRHSHGRETWGHSLCIDPWGEVVGELDNEPGYILCAFDAQKMAEIRQNMPVFQHRRHAHY